MNPNIHQQPSNINQFSIEQESQSIEKSTKSLGNNFPRGLRGGGACFDCLACLCCCCAIEEMACFECCKDC
ncbi:unnamed protein product [Adineta steineri]|uniref:Cysteine-rich transmembrane CYSTM domain-containing protein n=1 Tax=Adineta steineri TaxID=433720 RepID=A0A814LM51_9BILA|nr:unnamed protein product [Adineta steineri]CAF1415745.1 unnamed protein product [Adineta steineri]CAF1437083.1 unnamed protein product [Adineta steineri]